MDTYPFPSQPPYWTALHSTYDDGKDLCDGCCVSGPAGRIDSRVIMRKLFWRFSAICSSRFVLYCNVRNKQNFPIKAASTFQISQFLLEEQGKLIHVWIVRIHYHSKFSNYFYKTAFSSLFELSCSLRMAKDHFIISAGFVDLECHIHHVLLL